MKVSRPALRNVQAGVSGEAHRAACARHLLLDRLPCPRGAPPREGKGVACQRIEPAADRRERRDTGDAGANVVGGTAQEVDRKP